MKPDVILPDFTVEQYKVHSLSQRVDWANTYHKAANFYGKSKGENAVIYILDTAGTFQDHNDLKANNDPALNDNETSDPDKDSVSGHGTHCAGIAAASDNSYGVIGIAPKATLAARKVLTDGGSGSYAWIASQIRKVADEQLVGEHAGKKKIISLSLGGRTSSAQLHSAIKYAISKGCFVIAAAGNSGYNGTDTVLYPANYPEVIAVASIEKDEDPSRFSSGGKNIDVAAYGDGNYSTYKNNTYATLRGTSMACPVVSGLTALIVSEYDINTQEQLMEYFKQVAKDIFEDGFDKRTGFGTLKADLFKQPTEPEEPAPDPEPEPPAPEPEPDHDFDEQWLDIWLDQTFRVFITQNGGGRRHWAKVRIRPTAKVSSEKQLREVTDNAKRYFRNRGFVLREVNIVEATHWISYFFELIMERIYKTPAEVAEIWVEMDGLSIRKDYPIDKEQMTVGTLILHGEDIEINQNKTTTMPQIQFDLPTEKVRVDRNTNLGIEQLKEVIADFFGTIDAIIDLFNGKASDALVKLAGIVGKYQNFSEAIGIAFDQFQDLSEEESVEVITHAKQAFDLEDDFLEEKIERVMQLPVTGYAEFLDTVELIDDVQGVLNDPEATRWEKTRAMFTLVSTQGFDQGQDVVAFVVETIAAVKNLFAKKPTA